MRVVFAFVLLLAADHAIGVSLDQFISHYEPLDYDANAMMKDHARLGRSVGGRRHLLLKFNAFGRDFRLRLFPGSPSFTENALVTVDERPVTNHLSLLYHGVDENDPSARVHGTIATGVFSGHVRTPDVVYYIEPSSRYRRSAEGHSVIYRSSDVIMPQNGGCGHGNLAIHNLLARQSLASKQPVRERRAPLTDRTRCELKMVAEDTYYEEITEGLEESVKTTVVISLLTAYVDALKDIYETTNFDGTIGITFAIRNLIIETPSNINPTFSQPNIGVERFLELHSLSDYDPFCLSYRFTARDFDDGVLGLAYIGVLPNTGSAGGICERFRSIGGSQKSLNTGIVTIMNYGARVARRVVELTFAHEVGHNFGSQHDPVTTPCKPASGGNYIMFAHASRGDEPNNDELSPCSRTAMASLITGKGQDPTVGCFSEDTGAICGNEVVEDGEQCDCGLDKDNNFKSDDCCDCPNCMLAATMDCSPSQGPCCDNNCAFLTSTFQCQPQQQCSAASFCNSTSSLCPTGDFLDQTCNSNRSYCEMGECVGSFCLALDLTGCECTEEADLCSICCNTTDNMCVPTSQLAVLPAYMSLLPANGLQTPPGGVCNENEGYCDFLGNCRQTASDGALSRLAGSLFGGATFDSVIEWVQDMWWSVLLIVVGVLIGLFLIVFVVQLLLPTPPHVKARKERMKQQKNSQH